MNSYVKLNDFIAKQIPGDWGTESADETNYLRALCVRGADIENVNVGNYRELPTRFISKKHINRILPNDSIVIEISGGSPTQSTGRVSHIRDINSKVICSNFCRAFQIKNNFSAKYFYYLLKNIYNSGIFFNYESKTTGIKNLMLDIALDSINVSVPNLNIQNKIAAVLSALDSKIELNNRINAELETMAKTIYDYWFVQFDFPISAEQAVSMGKPELEGKPYKSSGGTMVWNEVLKREIPEEWEVILLSDWIERDKSGDWGKDEIEGNYTEEVFCIRGADLNGLNGKGEVKAPKRFILEKNSNKILDPHDLIVEISGGSPTQSTGRIAYLTKDTLNRFDAPIICSNFCKAVTLKTEKCMFNFAFEWNKAYEYGVLFGFEGKTSGIKNLLFESFVTSYLITSPPEHLIDRFYDFMTPLESRKQKNLSENQIASELRDWLLPMLMNGQVTAVG